MPFVLGEPLIEFIQEISFDYKSEVIRKAHISRTSLQKISKNCIAKELKQSIFSKLENSPFSLAIDEASDNYGSSYLAVSVKFLKTNSVTNKLVSIIPIGDSSTGEVLYKKILEEVLINDNVKKNLMGIATDGGSNMVGKEKGISSRLVKDFPHIFAMTDISHSYNLIFQKSLKEFPKATRNIVKKISSYFKRSPQRRARLFEIQKEMELKPLNVISYVKTRWLSFVESLRRILDLWVPLAIYFDENGDSNQKNFFSLQNEFYLRVLLTLTEKLNHYNLFFQRDHIFYDQITKTIRESYAFFEEMIFDLPLEDTKPPKFSDFYQLELNKNQLLDTVGIYTKSQFNKLFFTEHYKIGEKFNTLKSEEVEAVSLAAQKFILTTLKAMKEKLPFDNSLLSDISVIFLREFDKIKWERLGQRFVNIITEEEQQSFKDQVRRLGFNFEEDNGSTLSFGKINIVVLWLSKQEEYPLCFKLATALFVLPHSTVPVERVFSSLKNLKYDRRSRLTVENLETCLLSFQSSKSDRIAITLSMMNRYETMWKMDKDNKEAKVSKDDNVTEEKIEEGNIFGSGKNNILDDESKKRKAEVQMNHEETKKTKIQQEQSDNIEKS